MNSQLFSSSLSLSLVCFLLVILLKIQSASTDPDWCRPLFRCGTVKAGYPFWGGPVQPDLCGHPKLKLECGENEITTMTINEVNYTVLEINESTHTLKIAREDYKEGICPAQWKNGLFGVHNTTIDSQLFDFSPADEYENVTLLYGCPPPLSPNIPEHFTCQINVVTHYDHGFIEPGAKGPGTCNASVFVPVPKKSFEATIGTNPSALAKPLREGFELKWKVIMGGPCEDCTNSMGSCGYDIHSQKTICHCPDSSQPFFGRPCPTYPAPKGNGLETGAVIGIVAGAAAGIILIVFLFLIIRKRRKIAAQSKTKDLKTPPTSKGTSTTTTNTSLSQSIPSYFSSKSDLERGVRNTYLGAQVFSHTELEQATENFHPSKELGDGGFGTVYHGVLKDGRVVAVKRLYENNIKRVEQFTNEVEILTTLRHPNLVALYGCTSRHSRELLLVYEYIPNGTVADHLHGRNANSGLLPWPVRLSIAVETANALTFLHASDVIHRDVKTNNILLDNNFQVKVADFGLSRLFPTDVTHVSTAPQGTPGYVDPEYYQCYQLTDKSDVYSFGVVLIELISSLEAVDTNRHRHNINLSNMAVSKIQNHELNELVDPSLGFKTNSAVRRMVTTVAELAFRCLQQDRDMRPSMQEVLEVLKGIQNEQFGAEKAEVVDISTDDAALLKNTPPPISPDSAAGTDKWVSSSNTSNSSFDFIVKK